MSSTVGWSVTELIKTAAFLNVAINDLLPEETVEITKSSTVGSVEDSVIVAGTGFEPATSGL